jgi:hypothetical protein
MRESLADVVVVQGGFARRELAGSGGAASS